MVNQFGVGAWPTGICKALKVKLLWIRQQVMHVMWKLETSPYWQIGWHSKRGQSHNSSRSQTGSLGNNQKHNAAQNCAIRRCSRWRHWNQLEKHVHSYMPVKIYAHNSKLRKSVTISAKYFLSFLIFVNVFLCNKCRLPNSVIFSRTGLLPCKWIKSEKKLM